MPRKKAMPNERWRTTWQILSIITLGDCFLGSPMKRKQVPMTNITLQQLAQLLYDQGRLNMEEGMFCIISPDAAIKHGYDLSAFWKTPQRVIERILRIDFPWDCEAELHEAYAALAAIDGSIPVWRDVETDEPPKDGTLFHAYYPMYDNKVEIISWGRNSNDEKTWHIKNTCVRACDKFTHWTYPPAAPERKG